MFGYDSILEHRLWSYLISVLPSHSFNVILCSKDVFNLNEKQFITVFFMVSVFSALLEKFLFQDYEDIFSMIISRRFIVLVCTLDLWSTLN